MGKGREGGERRAGGGREWKGGAEGVEANFIGGGAELIKCIDPNEGEALRCSEGGRAGGREGVGGQGRAGGRDGGEGQGRAEGNFTWGRN